MKLNSYFTFVPELPYAMSMTALQGDGAVKYIWLSTV